MIDGSRARSEEVNPLPDVYNWHLGRQMHYAYQEQHPRRQFAFVFNTNRCIA